MPAMRAIAKTFPFAIRSCEIKLERFRTKSNFPGRDGVAITQRLGRNIDHLRAAIGRDVT